MIQVELYVDLTSPIEGVWHMHRTVKLPAVPSIGNNIVFFDDDNNEWRLEVKEVAFPVNATNVWVTLESMEAEPCREEHPFGGFRMDTLDELAEIWTPDWTIQWRETFWCDDLAKWSQPYNFFMRNAYAPPRTKP